MTSERRASVDRLANHRARRSSPCLFCHLVRTGQRRGVSAASQPRLAGVLQRGGGYGLPLK
ncbi:hypothetical protein INR49_008679 [Caranx melampygus]|nr:hypothetical protein INR49_008679 [Caranx melampygus]